MESVPLAFSAGDASDRTEKGETRIVTDVVAAFFLVLFLVAILALPSHCSIFRDHHTRHPQICPCPSRGDLGRQFAAPVDGPKPEKAHMEGKHDHVKRPKKAKAAKPPKIHQGEAPPAAAK